MKLETTVNGVNTSIDLPGVSQQAYDTIKELLDRALGNPKTKNREAITESWLYAVRTCSTANPSDLWHHVVYRLYCDTIQRHKPQDPKQSWVRASGDALETAVEQWYTPVLAPHDIRIEALISGQGKRRALQAMGLADQVGGSKLDIALWCRTNHTLEIFGGVHIKASLAERVSDDVPASRAMMTAGFFSPLWTLDVKSFPPPQGDLVNRGELGSPKSPSDKRRYIEEHGDFDNCYSGNLRTAPSESSTPSGKKVYQLNLSKQPDDFAEEVIRRATHWLSAKKK